jgi:hypothetical protein
VLSSNFNRLTSDEKLLFVVLLEIWDHYDIGGVFKLLPIAAAAAVTTQEKRRQQST